MFVFGVFWSVFSRIRTEYGEKLQIRTLYTQRLLFLNCKREHSLDDVFSSVSILTTFFTTFSSVSIVRFEQINVNWVISLII